MTTLHTTPCSAHVMTEDAESMPEVIIDLN